MKQELINTGKIILPGGAGGRSKKFHELSNFKKAKAELEATGKLNMNYFNNAKDIGMFLDWYNKAVETKRREYNDNEITEISKLVARIQGRKTILLDKNS